MSETERLKARKVIRYALIRIGFRMDQTGFQYLSTAIEFVIVDPKLLHKMMSGLFKDVCAFYDVKKVSSVQSAIRNMIDTTFSNHTFLEINKMFHIDIFAIDDKPSCGQIIGLIAEYYNLKLYQQEEFFAV